MLRPGPTLISIVEEALLLIPCKDRNCCKSFGAKEKTRKKLCSIKKEEGGERKEGLLLANWAYCKKIRMTHLIDLNICTLLHSRYSTRFISPFFEKSVEIMMITVFY